MADEDRSVGMGPSLGVVAKPDGVVITLLIGGCGGGSQRGYGKGMVEGMIEWMCREMDVGGGEVVVWWRWDKE